MFPNDATMSRLCRKRKKNPACDRIHNEKISLPHQIFQIAWLALDQGRHLNPMITQQRL